MAHDVFISYSSKDKPIADATCATLEAKGIRCWIAPRDIRPGADWGEAIVDAIHESRVFVLVFSNNANESPQIKREVERAINRGIPVIPLRIENVMPVKSLEYFLSTPHWLDAFSPPLEHHLNYLAAVVQSVLDGKPAPAPLPTPQPKPGPLGGGIDRRLLIGGGVGVVALAGAGYFLFGRKPSFVGNWTAASLVLDSTTPSPFAPFSINAFFQAVAGAGKLSATFSLDEVGSFKFSWGGDDTGMVVPQGNNAVGFASDLAHHTTPFTYMLMPNAPPQLISALGGMPGQQGLMLNAPNIGGDSWLLGTPSGPGITGLWSTDTPTMGPLDATHTNLDITADGRYHYSFRFSEAGTFEAANGQWSRNRPGSLPITGTYKFDGGDKVTAAGGGGVTVWVRAT